MNAFKHRDKIKTTRNSVHLSTNMYALSDCIQFESVFEREKIIIAVNSNHIQTDDDDIEEPIDLIHSDKICAYETIDF